MDFGGLLVMGIVWALFSLLRRTQGGSKPRPRTTSGAAGSRTYSAPTSERGSGDATQREGSRLEMLLRELERNLGEAGPQGRSPAGLPMPPLPDDEDVEERESLERPERVVSLETPVNRRAREQYDQDAGAEDLVRRRIAAAAARSGPATSAGHRAFDQHIRQEPADHTAVRRYTPAQLRDAVVWREILGPPVSERDQ